MNNQLNAKDPVLLYHFTCEMHLPMIARTGELKPSESNAFCSKARDVVWMTSLPTPENNGLIFADGIPDDLNKTFVRFTIYRRRTMISWLEWTTKVGMSKEMMDILIHTANAEETHKFWYVSEESVTSRNWLIVENLHTGEIYYKAKGF